MTDVAKRAKVSKMTVSRVLSGNGYVKEETRAAVQSAVQALNYRPNLLAKSLVTGRTYVIAYALPDICDPYFGNVCKGMTEACGERGYNSIVSNTTSADAMESFLNMVIDRKVDGVVFHHLCVMREQVDLLLENGIKSVLIDNEQTLDNAVNINNDNYQGARMVTEFLIGRGYRKIACVRGNRIAGEVEPEDMSYVESFQEKIWDDRTQGYLDALRSQGLESFGMYSGRGSAAMDRGYACGQQVMRRILTQEQLPDAIYCESDVIALGLLSELLESRIPVPQTIALSGHDGLDTSRFLYPRITTVVQPQYEVGRMAAQALIAEIEGEPQPYVQTVPSVLFLGDTTP